MRTRQTVALTLAMAFATGLIMQPGLRAGAAQEAGTIAGTAKREARKPFPEYSVRVRNVQQGVIAATVQLDPSGDFTLAGVDPANYLVELLNAKGKVVCTEGPFDLSKQPSKTGVNIECGKPAAWWLLAAAGAAGITAGVVANDPASPAR
ncbi:MAG: carboxypeptidase regulatory-like domain-containing protein [Acidobacteria bacterium]|nr:carboxypeptidase regulatory-like domain-containing protein [Acidobacteriota bacterium]